MIDPLLAGIPGLVSGATLAIRRPPVKPCPGSTIPGRDRVRPSTMALEVTVAEVGQGGRRVTLRGRLDSLTAPVLEGRLAPLLESATVTALLLDLAGLEYISSAGIRALVKARRTLERRGGGIAVVNVQPAVRQVFDIVKALPSIDSFADDAELDAYLERMQRRAAPPQ
jgi:anti-anti-sigma factor